MDTVRAPRRSSFVHRFTARATLGALALGQAFVAPGARAEESATTASAIATGLRHSCAIIDEGSVRCWGWPDSGVLGDGQPQAQRVAVQVTGITSGASSVAAGMRHSCATVSGGVKCWGANESGQLGDGTTTGRMTPVSTFGIADAVSVTAGDQHTCALTSAGGVRCWGRGDYGQLGDTTSSNRFTPVTPVGLSSGVTQVAAGGLETCAILTGGALRCWGSNWYGEIGDGTTSTRYTPTPVSGLSSGVVSVSVGENFVCAVVTGGAVKCWGRGAYGRLGNVNGYNQTTPGAVAGVASDATSVAAGDAWACALMTSATLRCWGANRAGQFGDGAFAEAMSAIAIPNLTGVTAVASGGGGDEGHTCVIVETGAVRCAGRNYDYELGDASERGNRSTYGTVLWSVQAPPAPTSRAVPLDTGARIGFALTGGSDGGSTVTEYVASCESSDGGAAGSVTTTTSPVIVPDLTPNATYTCTVRARNAIGLGEPSSDSPIVVGSPRTQPVALTAGEAHTCLLTYDSHVRCWGRNLNGQLGIPASDPKSLPVEVPDLSAAAVDAGKDHTCALTTSAAAVCWGRNDYGQLGNNSTENSATPVTVSGLSSGVVAISAGELHTCAVTSAGAVKCWGRNSDGQLGDGTTTDRLSPVQVSGLAAGYSGVSAGGFHTCATTSSNSKCWGKGDSGQFGNGQWTSSTVPVAGPNAVPVRAGKYHTCGITSPGAVSCWGLGTSGQIGYWIRDCNWYYDYYWGYWYEVCGDYYAASRATPNGITYSGAAGLFDAGGAHTCLVVTGALQCLGANWSGQLGNGSSYGGPTSATNVPGLSSDVRSVAVGDSHTCAIVGAIVKCWGANGSSQLGDGTRTNRNTPVDVLDRLGSVPPPAPTITAVSPGGGRVVVSFTPNVNDGGAPLTGFTGRCISSDGGVTGTGSSASSPVSVTGLTNRRTYTCTVSGINTAGTGPASAASASVTPNSFRAVQVAAGQGHTCALTATGGTRCWGSNTISQVDGDTSPCNWPCSRLEPVSVPGMSSGVASVQTGANHTCALTTAGGVKCWGSNGAGQLGVSASWYQTTVTDMEGATSGVAGIATHLGEHTCILTTSGGVKCVGSNSSGQVGDGTFDYSRRSLTQVVGLTSGVREIQTGLQYSCAVMTSDTLQCWGNNYYGTLGVEGNSRNTPVVVPGLTGVHTVAIGGHTTCALMHAGNVKCWGYNGTAGLLGTGSEVESTSTPSDVTALGTDVTAIAFGGGHACALMRDTSLRCWGSNYFGQLGDGTTTSRRTPQTVPGLTGVVAVTAGYGWTCAALSSGAIKCLGANDSGTLGEGTTTRRNVPTSVLDFGADVPFAPTITAVDVDGRTATVSFDPPSDDGGSPITSYEATCTSEDGGETRSTTGASSPLTVEQLGRGRTYACSVTATSDAGMGDTSAPSSSFAIPTIPPGAPSLTGVERGDLSATVSFAAPDDDGGDAITSYTATCTSDDGGTTGSSAGALSPLVVDQLTRGATYRCAVLATNGQGDGAASSASDPFVAITLPGAPSITGLARGDRSATVSFVEGEDSGEPNSSFTVDCNSSDGGATASSTSAASPITVTDLTLSAHYACTVSAANALGSGPSSEASASFLAATLPGAPTGVTVTRGDLRATVAFDAPVDDGEPITGYVAECVSDDGGDPSSATGAASPILVESLSRGRMYRCSVTATNEIGDGAASDPSASFLAATIPGAPTGLSITRGDRSVTVAFDAPADDGDDPVSSYATTCSSADGGTTSSSSDVSSPLVVESLTRGTTYACSVVASNGIGDGPASDPSASFVVATLAGAPSGVTVSRGDLSASVSFAPPEDDGGDPISSYMATCTSEGGGEARSESGAGSPIVVGSLTRGASYACSVVAANEIGDGPVSDPSASFVAATTPQPPAVDGVSRADRSITVSFTPSSDDGDDPISSFTASCSSSNGGALGSSSGAGSPIAVNSLTNGKSYTCTVHATNEIGNSAESGASLAIVPATVPQAPAALTSAPGDEDGEIVLSWAAPADDGGEAVTSYVLGRGTAPDALTDIATLDPSTTSYTDSDLEFGQTYHYAIRAINAIGDSPTAITSMKPYPWVAPLCLVPLLCG